MGAITNMLYVWLTRIMVGMKRNEILKFSLKQVSITANSKQFISNILGLKKIYRKKKQIKIEKKKIITNEARTR